MAQGSLDRVLGTATAQKALPVLKREYEPQTRFEFNITPTQLYEELSESVIGQREAMQSVCNSVCYHYQGLSNNEASEKSNLLFVGPTGCGKTYVIRKISELLNIPFLIADATRFSGTGYTGDNVDSLVQDLVIKSEGDTEAASRGIIYLDEIDKLAAQPGTGRDVSGRDVQNGLLKIIEEGDVKVIGSEGEAVVNTKNILFIGGGAFSGVYNILKGDYEDPLLQSGSDGEALADSSSQELLVALKQYGMIPELLGRIPVIAKFRELNQEDLVNILKESDDSPIESYVNDFRAYGINARFNEDSFEAIAKLAYERGMGARGLKSVLEETLSSFKFNLPGSRVRKVEFSKETFENPTDSLVSLMELKNTCKEVI